jgi:hypothetical protein
MSILAVAHPVTEGFVASNSKMADTQTFVSAGEDSEEELDMLEKSIQHLDDATQKMFRDLQREKMEAQREKMEAQRTIEEQRQRIEQMDKAQSVKERKSVGKSIKDIRAVYESLNEVLNFQTKSFPTKDADGPIFVMDKDEYKDSITRTNRDMNEEEVADLRLRYDLLPSGERNWDLLPETTDEDKAEEDGDGLTIMMWWKPYNKTKSNDEHEQDKSEGDILMFRDDDVPIYYKLKTKKDYGATSLWRMRTQMISDINSYWIRNKTRAYLAPLLLLNFNHAFGFHYEQLDDFIAAKIKKKYDARTKEFVLCTDEEVAAARTRFKEYVFNIADPKYEKDQKKKVVGRLAAAEKRKRDEDESGAGAAGPGAAGPAAASPAAASPAAASAAAVSPVSASPAKRIIKGKKKKLGRAGGK